jgi:hypothetical protein
MAWEAPYELPAYYTIYYIPNNKIVSIPIVIGIVSFHYFI